MSRKFSIYKNLIIRNGSFVFLASIAIGVPSVVVLYVADSVLIRRDFSTFIKVWALTNTLIVGVTSPLFTYAPNLRLDFKDKLAQFDRQFFSVSVLISLVIIFPIELIAAYWIFDITKFTFLMSLSVFIIFSITFNVKNALLISKGAYGGYFLSASIFGAIASVSLILVNYFKIQSISMLFIVFSFAFGIACTDRLLSLAFGFSWQDLRVFISQILKMNTFTPFLITVFITSGSTFILNGPLLFGSYIGASASQLATFGTCLNIVLICYTILNSFTAPIQTSLLSSLDTSDIGHFNLIYRKSFGIYLLFTLLFTIFLTFTINFLAKIYIPSVLYLNLMTRMILVAGLGFSTLSGLPRLGLMISKRYCHLFFIWCGGLVVFIVVVLLPIDPISAMALAPTISSFFILGACTMTFKNRTYLNLPISYS